MNNSTLIKNKNDPIVSSCFNFDKKSPHLGEEYGL